MIKLNNETFDELVNEDIDWLNKQPRSLERDHIKNILQGNLIIDRSDSEGQNQLQVMPNEVIAGVIKYCTERIKEIVSDKRYNRENPATIQTNAPLALMQVAWETEADTLRKINIMLTDSQREA